MRTTEENIVYQLLGSIRAAELNNDEVIGERDIRSMMRVQRAELIMKYSLKGLTIQDICFQDVPLVLTTLNELELTAPIPNLIHLPSDFGIKLKTLNNYNISVVGEESYYLSKRNPVIKFQPKAKLSNNVIQFYTGIVPSNAIGGAEELAKIIDCLKRQKEILFSAVLDNPDDSPNYDWTTSQYPFPSELISELKKNILRRDLNIILETKSDQVPNAKNDTLRYHDQGKVQS